MGPLEIILIPGYDALRGQHMVAKNPIDGTPEKHIFRGMIADYNLQTGICELLDNALDFWVANKKISKLKVEVADSDEVAHRFRFDVARDSDMMSPV